MPYLNLDLDYFTHPKVIRLMNILGTEAVIYPIKLWCYAAKHFPRTGMLDGCSKHDIEKMLGWTGTEGMLVDSLVRIGLIENKTETYKIHDWHEHAGHLWAFKRRAKTAAKKRWKDYATSNRQAIDKNAKGCAPILPILPSSLHPQKDSEKKEKDIVPPRGETWSEAELVLSFLNEKTGKHFHARHPNGDPTKSLQLVHSLLRKGYTLLNLRQVIANRCLKWRDDPKMEEFLRPETIFRPSNFGSYLGELGKGMSHEPVS